MLRRHTSVTTFSHMSHRWWCSARLKYGRSRRKLLCDREVWCRGRCVAETEGGHLNDIYRTKRLSGRNVWHFAAVPRVRTGRHLPAPAAKGTYVADRVPFFLSPDRSNGKCREKRPLVPSGFTLRRGCEDKREKGLLSACSSFSLWRFICSANQKSATDSNSKHLSGFCRDLIPISTLVVFHKPKLSLFFLSPLLFLSLDVAYLTHKMALYPSEDGKQEKQPVQTDLWGKVSEQKKLWVCCFRGLGYLCRPSGPSETSSRLFKHFVFPSCLHSPTSRGSDPTLCRTLCRPVPTSDWFRWDGGSTATGSLL